MNRNVFPFSGSGDATSDVLIRCGPFRARDFVDRIVVGMSINGATGSATISAQIGFVASGVRTVAAFDVGAELFTSESVTLTSVSALGVSDQSYGRSVEVPISRRFRAPWFYVAVRLTVTTTGGADVRGFVGFDVFPGSEPKSRGSTLSSSAEGGTEGFGA